MQKKLIILFLIGAGAHEMPANTISVLNTTPGQVSIIIETPKKISPSQSILPQKNNVDNPIKPLPTSVISYDDNPIQKILITRLSTNMPQIIYYSTSLDTNYTSGIAALNKTGKGFMKVSQSSVDINNLLYDLLDLSSYGIKINHLKNELSSTNLDLIKKQIDDLVAMIPLVQASDQVEQLTLQIAVIQSGISELSHSVDIMNILNKHLKTIQDLQIKLTNNNLDEIQKSVKVIAGQVQGVSQIDLQGALLNQFQLLDQAIKTLQSTIDKRSIKNPIQPPITV